MAKLEATTTVIVGTTNEKELIATPEDGFLTFYLDGKEIFCMDRENFIDFASMVKKTEG